MQTWHRDNFNLDVICLCNLQLIAFAIPVATHYVRTLISELPEVCNPSLHQAAHMWPLSGRSVPCRASCHSFQYTAAHLTVLPLSSASPQPTIILIGLPSARGGVDRGGRSRKGSQCRRAALGAGLMPKERGRSRRSRRPLRVPLRRGNFPRTFYRRSWAQGASEGGPRGLPGASRALFSPEIYLMSCKAPEKLLASCSEVPTALPLLPPRQSPEALLPQQQLLLLTSKADTGAPRARGHLRRWSAVAMATGGGWAPRGPRLGCCFRPLMDLLTISEVGVSLLLHRGAAVSRS